ncbi:NfeD family protein [Calidithermus roseus]|nr:NfeD family protein [Calidithermus roseus]
MKLVIRLVVFLLLLALGWAGAKSYIIPIEGAIDQPLAIFLEQSLERAEREGASGVVLYVDTPGGRVDAAIRMSDAILASPLPTIAVVQNAFSAGALISLSAQQIYMLPGSEIGAALPITVTPITQPEPADRKVISALRGKFRAVAEARGRPVNLAEAMVDPEREVPGLSTRGEPLTLSAQKAAETKIADGVVSSLGEALEKAGFNAQTERLEPGTRVNVARFLTNQIVAAILLAVGILGIALEFFTPGTFLPATIGIISLTLYFLGGYLAGFSSLLEISLFVGGLLLLLVELFVTPGFGVLGGLGIAGIVASVYLTFGSQSVAVGSYAIVIVAFGLFLMFRFFPRSRLGRSLVLESAIGEQAPPRDELQDMVGAIGTALTDLRPAGTALFGERRVDVVTQGEFIERGTPIRVTKVEGVRVVVRKEG